MTMNNDFLFMPLVFCFAFLGFSSVFLVMDICLHRSKKNIKYRILEYKDSFKVERYYVFNALLFKSERVIESSEFKTKDECIQFIEEKKKYPIIYNIE